MLDALSSQTFAFMSIFDLDEDPIPLIQSTRIGLEHYTWMTGSKESSQSNMPIKGNVHEDKLLTFISTIYR